MTARNRRLALQRYLDVATAADESTFKRRLVEMAESAGFSRMAAMMVIEDPSSPRGNLWRQVSNPPEAYKALSEDPALVARCPVTQRSKRLSVPFVYDQALYVAEGVEDMWETQAPFGYHTGIATALHLADRTHFVFGFDREAALPSCSTRLTRLLADLQLLAVHAHAAAERLWKPGLLTARDKASQLTQREIEVLQWTLIGKTAWEVGRILGIGERTVVFHAMTAMRKLGAVSKQQAALKAFRLGVIS